MDEQRLEEVISKVVKEVLAERGDTVIGYIIDMEKLADYVNHFEFDMDDAYTSKWCREAAIAVSDALRLDSNVVAALNILRTMMNQGDDAGSALNLAGKVLDRLGKELPPSF